MPAPIDDALMHTAIVDTATVVQRYVRGRENQISPPEVWMSSKNRARCSTGIQLSSSVQR